MWAGEGDADAIIDKRGPAGRSPTPARSRRSSTRCSPRTRSQVEEYRAGKEKAFNSLVGQAMKATKGKANPAQVNEILKSKLAGG